ncbi:uncharacterized protein [Lepeophtheirus salmonis]|uniref:Complement component 1, q subcomponentlike 4 like [Danio rerio] n=2 Tax=Lepeophtheirus salmonis TaxID=72036 RepID=A0A0K2TKI7_LEPSM|nr:uncharacterized protein PFB0145c-like isoform X2 [Lepeophtheirus salmonis]
MADNLEQDLNATTESCNNFNNKLTDTLRGLITANKDRKDEIDALRGDHEQLRKDHDAFVVSAERENDLRKNEVKSLEERQQKDNQARIVDISKLEGKLDTENSARKSEIQDLDKWAKGENDARKTEIANLDNFAKSENDARKAEIADLNNFAKTENDGRISDIAALNSRMDSENKQRSEEDKNLNERVDKEIKDREEALKDLQNRMDSQNDDRNKEMDELRTRMMKENAFLKSLAGKPLSVYFDAYRTKAYDGGGEENLTFNGVSCNVGGGLDPESGVFIAPIGGAYIFIFHVATHDNKKALLSIRHNGEEVASIFDQNHKDNHKNSMAGTTILLSLKKGDEVVVYAYTGTWLADFPMNHYTHWVGLLLKPSEEAIQEFRDSAEEGNFEEVPAN